MRLNRLFRRWWFMAIVVVAAIVIGGVALSLSRPAEQATSGSVQTSATTAASATMPTTASGVPQDVPEHLTDKNWLLAGYQVVDDGTGFFTGQVTVTNQASVRRSGLFELVILVNGHQVGTLFGQTTAPVDAGATTVVELPVGDHFVPGPYTVDFHEAFA